MTCASCGRANRAGARFCSGCGQSLAPRCPSCGAENAADARFCDACGAALAATASAPVETTARKVVTIVFADLVGSVALHERLDAESARRFMARYHDAMAAVVRAHGGTVVQLLGDGVLCAFGVPRVAEDDAVRGVRAAVAMQAAFRELLGEQAAAVGAAGLRIAVNTGEVIVAEDQTSVIGDPANVAARLQQEARDGDVVLGEATQRLVAGKLTLEPLGTFALRGRVEPVAAYRVVSLDPPAVGQGTAFVGREDELRRLRAVFEAAVAAPGARLAVLLGSPGLGKSRLLAELARRVGDRAVVLSARCDPSRGRSFAPIAAALRERLGLGDADEPEAIRAAVDAVVPGAESERARLATGLAALLAGAPASPEETFFVVRRLLAALAAARPVVLVIDDVQWAEPLLLDLAEHLVEWSSGVPLLVLLGSRPELRELRSSLATPGGVVTEVVMLSGLEASAAARLAANAVGAEELPAALVGRVLAASEGNPLFVGELVRMLVHDGALRRDGDRWVAGVELARLEMPPTIHALLAARIERLGPDERALLERAAVVGRRFSRAAVAHLLQRDPAELDAKLESLRRTELIEPDSGWFLGEPGLRFHHALIRDAAYRRVLRRTRAELHERLADWIAAQADGAPEHEEPIGWHLEQAHRHLRELGPLDAHGAAVGGRAARHLGAAGRMALARDELRLAADLVGRALECLDAADPARADLALDWCEALLAAGEVGLASRAVEELARFAPRSERLCAWHACFAAELAVLTHPESLRASAESAAAAAAALAAAGDAAGEAKAHSVHATALARLGRLGASEAALDRALAAARRARDRRRANGVLAGAPVAALYGPSPVARASGRCLDVVRVLRITQGAPAVEAVALRCQAVLEALRGRVEAARRMIAAARRTVEELGLEAQLLEVEFFAGYIELLQGDAEAAARCLSVAYEGLREHGLGIDAARAAALLARARLAQGDAIGAEVLSQESERLAGDDLNAAIAWRGVRAEALARRGEHAAAIELARAAVEIAAATDALLQHANARRALAVALRAAGRSAEADAEDARAIELWEAKGASLLAERATRARPALAVSRAAETADSRAEPAPASERANAAARAVTRSERAWRARDWDAVVASYSPSHVMNDHRALFRVQVRGDAFFANERLLFETSDSEWSSELVAARGEHLALLRVRFGARAEAGAGPLAVEMLDLVEVDGEGRRIALDVFDLEARDAAHAALEARFAAHGAAPLAAAPGPRIENAATRSLDRFGSAWNDRDWDACVALYAPGFRSLDRRRLMQLDLSREEHLAYMRELYDAIVAHLESHVLATRGERLCVARLVYSGRSETIGPSETEQLALVEVDERGDRIALVRFDPDALEEVYAELERRYEAGEAAPFPAAREALRRLERAMSARDWDGLASVFSHDLVFEDHRRMGFGTLHSRDEYLARLRALFELAPDARSRADHVLALDGRGILNVGRWEGTRAGGRFEIAGANLFALAADGRIRRWDAYELDQLDEARARFAELRSDPLRVPPNAAARADQERLGPLVVAGDWDALRALVTPDFEFDDRRKGALVRGDVEVYVRNLSFMASLGEIARGRELLATSGQRLALERFRYRGGAGAGAFEGEFLRLVELDAQGRLRAVLHFDPDDRRAASAELLERADPSPMREFRRIFNARDLERVRGALRGDFVFDDHRRTGLGRLEGAAAYVAALAALFAESPDAAAESLYELAADERGELAVTRSFGRLRDGGAFERVFVRATRHDGARLVSIDLFELDQLERARECFGAFARAPERLAPFAAPNSATAALDRLFAALGSGDGAGARALCAGGAEIERALAALGRCAATGARVTRAIVGSADAQSALELVRGSGGESLWLVELDAAGRIAVLREFAPAERSRALRELRDGLCARDPLAAAVLRPGIELNDAFNARDGARARAILADGFVLEDHRRVVRLGALAGPAYADSVRVLAELASAVQVDTPFRLALEPYGVVSVVQVSGTLAHGGEFEGTHLVLMTTDAGRVERIEFFELDDGERAVARLAELRPAS